MKSALLPVNASIARLLIVLLLLAGGGRAFAQLPPGDERRNLLDHLLGSNPKAGADLEALDFNGDMRVDVADMIHHVNVSRDFPELSFAQHDSAVSEGKHGGVLIEIQSSRIFNGSIALQYGGSMVAGQDYEPGPTALAFNGRSAQLVLNLIPNNILDPTRTIEVTLLNEPLQGYLAATPEVHTIYVHDDDASPATAFFATSTTALNEEPAVAQIEIGFSIPFNGRVNYTVGGTAVAGQDYQALPGFIDVSGSTAQIPIALLDDLNTETPETIILTLAPPGGQPYSIGTPATHTVRITELATSFAQASTTVDESATTHSLEVRFALDYSGELLYTISGTATEGQDYEDPQGGAISVDGFIAEIPILIIDDKLFESTETIIITLGKTDGYELTAPYTHTIHLNDNDREWKGNISQSLSQVDITLRIERQGSAVSGVLVSDGNGGLPGGEYALQELTFTDARFEAVIAPITVEAEITMAHAQFRRWLRLSARADIDEHLIQPRLIRGIYEETLEAVDPEKAYYNRTLEGNFTLVLQAPQVPVPEVSPQ